MLDNWLRNYEQARADVQKLKQQYLAKTRRADDAEDEYESHFSSGLNISLMMAVVSNLPQPALLLTSTPLPLVSLQ